MRVGYSLPDIRKDEHVVIVRSAYIGDWIVILPFVEYLMSQYELDPSEISFLILNKSNLNPAKLVLGQEHPFSKNTLVANLQPSKIFDAVTSIRKEFKKKNKVDHVILLPFTNDGFLSVIKKKSLCYTIFGLHPVYSGFNYSFEPHAISTSQYLSVFEKFGITDFDLRKYNALQIPKRGTVEQRIVDKKRIALYVHSKLAMKIWPKEKYQELIVKINQEFKANFFLIGAPEDQVYNEELIAGLVEKGQQQISVENLAGTMSIPQTLDFLCDIDLLICNDGAPAHFASLVNLPSIAIFTYKEPVGAWEPLLGETFISIRTDVSCKHCFKEFCSNPVCIREVSVATVSRYSELLLKGELIGNHSIVELKTESSNYQLEDPGKLLSNQ